MKGLGALWDFIVDYLSRHKHPVNAVLHIAGVPAAFYGLYRMVVPGAGVDRQMGLALLILGYVLQYLGHRAQGNEVGEVILIKKLASRVSKRKAGHG